MKFPYISVEPIVIEAQSDVKKLLKTSSFSDEDCYIWAIDASREIGGHNYDVDVAEISIKRHTGHLPKDFYLLDNMWLCRPDTSCAAKEPVRPGYPVDVRWIRTVIIRPADAATRRYCQNNCTVTAPQTYTIKLPPGILRTSFAEGTVSMDYLKIPMKNGIVLIQDEINGIKAIKNYIKMMLLQENYLMGEVRNDVYQEIKSEWESYLRLAQQQQKAPNAADTDLKTIEQDQRYRNFRYRNQ